MEAALMEMGGLPDRWSVIQRYYDNHPPKWTNSLIPGHQVIHFPLIFPKVNRLATTTVGSLMRPDTILIGKQYGNSQRTEHQENTLQFFWETGRVENRLRSIAPIAGNTNAGILRVMFDAVREDFKEDMPENVTTMPGHLGFCGFRFDAIHPGNFILHPSTPYGIEASQVCGHRFYQTRQAVGEKQKTKRYFDEISITSSRGPSQHDHGRDWNASLLAPGLDPHSESEPVECWDLIFRKDLGDGLKRYRATIAIDTSEVLAIEPYTYSRIWYRDFGFKEQQFGSFWHSGSVGYDLQSLQVAYTHLNNLSIYGLYMNAIPALIGSGLPEKVMKYMAGDVIDVTGAGGPVQAIVTTFQAARMLPMFIEKIERLAETITRTSVMASGGKIAGEVKATEAAAIMQGQQQGENDYLMTFGASMIDVADMMREQLFYNWHTWRPVYGDQLPQFAREELLRIVRWTIQGRGPESSPEMQLIKFEKLIEKAMQFGDVNSVNPETGQPGMFDIREILRSYVNALQLANAEKVMPDQPVMSSGPAAGLTPEMLQHVVPALLASAGQAGIGSGNLALPAPA